MLKTLRTNTKWIMITVSVCFVGMIVWGWGMDILGRRSGVRANIVGKVNGEKIPYSVYENFVKMQRQRYGSDSRLTVDQERRIHEEAWNTLVTQMVVEQDMKKRKITFTDRELVEFMRNNPPDFVFQPQLAPLFQENDRFSMAKYKAFLSPENLKNPQTARLLNYIEAEARNRLPAVKFQESLTSAVVVSEAQVRERWLMENERRKVDWVFINANSVTEVGSGVEPDELRAYYEAHKDEYKRGKRRIVSAVFFSLTPSPKDSAEVLDLARMLVEKARSGSDFAELANEYTDDPGNTDPAGNLRGGDLGFFGKGRMVPEFEKAAFSLKPGEVSDPVLTQFGYHVIKVDSVKYKEDNPKEIEQVKARHILLNIEPSRETREAVEKRIEAFRNAVESGVDFAVRAQVDSLRMFRFQPFEEDAAVIPGLPGSTKLYVHRAFDAKVGELLPTYMTNSGFYVLKVEEELPAGIASLDEVRREVERAAMNEKRVKYAEEVVNRIYDRMKGGMSLKEAVEADDFKRARFNSGEVYRSYYIPGLGTMNAFVARMFALEKPGDTTGPVVLDSGAGIAVLKEIMPIDEDRYLEERDQLKQRMETELKNEVINRYVENLVKNADIVDNRHLFVGY